MRTTSMVYGLPNYGVWAAAWALAMESLTGFLIVGSERPWGCGQGDEFASGDHF